MKIVIELDELKDRLVRTGLLPEGYDVESLSQAAYSTTIEIELKKREPVRMRHIGDSEDI